jgi:hypothetical protein
MLDLFQSLFSKLVFHLFGNYDLYLKRCALRCFRSEGKEEADVTEFPRRNVQKQTRHGYAALPSYTDFNNCLKFGKIL